jgi:hypothetical protein
LFAGWQTPIFESQSLPQFRLGLHQILAGGVALMEKPLRSFISLCGVFLYLTYLYALPVPTEEL